MGFRVSWIARAGTSTNELLVASRCHVTGERHDFPDVGFYLLELPDAVGSLGRAGAHHVRAVTFGESI